LSLLQKSVTFAQALAVFRPLGCKTAFFSGCCCKAEVLQQPLLIYNIFFSRECQPEKETLILLASFAIYDYFNNTNG
jgi:hypothetical protein